MSVGGLYDYIKIYLENLHEALCFAIAKNNGISCECHFLRSTYAMCHWAYVELHRHW